MKFTWLCSIEGKLLVTFAIALSSLLPSRSLCLRGSLKKDVGKLKGCDRCLGSLGGAIAVWEVGGVRSLFGKLRGVRSLFGKLRGVRSLFGKLEGVRSLFGE